MLQLKMAYKPVNVPLQVGYDIGVFGTRKTALVCGKEAFR